MSMWNLLRKLQMAIQAARRQKPDPAHPASPVSENPEIVRLRALVEMVAKTDQEECGCDDVFDLIDQYAESVLQSQDPALLMPKVKYHLAICRGCCEEYEMLLQILQMGQT